MHSKGYLLPYILLKMSQLSLPVSQSVNLVPISTQIQESSQNVQNVHAQESLQDYSSLYSRTKQTIETAAGSGVTLVNFGSNQDFAFLINIIKTLEKTIEALNKRLETYENQTQTQNVPVMLKEKHINTVHEKENPNGMSNESNEKHSESAHENENKTPAGRNASNKNKKSSKEKEKSVHENFEKIQSNAAT